MRLTVLTTALRIVQPGASISWDVEVTNDGAVIEGVVCRIPEFGDEFVTVAPRELPLFPGETGKLTVTAQLGDGFPAGRRVVEITATTTVTAVVTSGHVQLEVLPRSAAVMSILPAVQRTRRTANYSVTYSNKGNQPLNVVLSGVDPDRSMRYEFGSSTLQTQPGQSITVGLTVRHRRFLTGGEIGRPFEVVSDGDALDLTTQGTLRQRPIIARGLLTMVALVLIVGLWATAFLVGLNAAYSSDALTKTAPASFFLTNAQKQGLAAATEAGDVVPKKGVLAPGVGGSISGNVRAVSTGRAVGRITVTAWRPTPTGLQFVTSAASQGDGSYGLVGLFPGSYKLQFKATGYREVWFPTASNADGAVPVYVGPGTVTPSIDVAVAGNPGSISGEVDPGEATKPLTITVTARSLLATKPGPDLIVTATKNATGNDGEYSYTLPALATPDTYQISVASAGYASSLTSDDVQGGQDRNEPTVRLSAGTTSLSGVVTDGTKSPLGGVAVTITGNGQVFTTTTPTTGAGVGTFTQSNLPTPGTYVLSFVKPGFSADPVSLQVEPGAAPAIQQITMVAGTDVITGLVTDKITKLPLGNVTVTLGGAPTPLSTTTLTTQRANGKAQGSYSLAGLPATGTYTLTFAAAGYTSYTVPINRDRVSSATPAPVNVALEPSAVNLTGHVSVAKGHTNVGVTITLTDGQHVRSTTTTNASPGIAAGDWTLPGVAPGTYTLTASELGLPSATTIVTVTSAGVRPVNLTLGTS